MSNVKVISQYVKDLSFECPNAPQVFLNPSQKPNINLSIDLNATKIGDDLFEIILKITADASADKKRTFLCEITYGGAFQVKNVENEMLEQILLIYCPNLIFPFIRRIIANLTTDSGFPSLMLDPIDFTDLYNRRKLASEATPINDTRN